MGASSATEGAVKNARFTRTMRHTREQLVTSSGIQPIFDVDLTRHYARNRLRAGFVLPALTLLVAMITWWLSPDSWIVEWFFATIAAQLGILYLSYRFLRDVQDYKGLKQWSDIFVLSEVGHSILWAVFLYYLGQNSNLAVTLMGFVATMMLVAIITMFCSAIKRAVLWSTFLPVIVLVQNLLSSDQIMHQFIGGMMLVVELYFLLLSQQLYATTRDTLLARAEKDELIYELEHAKGNSDEARRRAEEASHAKSRFLASMSHELRTPLNAIIGFSEVMKNELFGPITNPNYKEYVNDIHGSGQHLLNLINEILDLSRIEAGRFDLREEAVFLDEVAEDCVHLLKLRATNKQIEIETKYHPGMPPVWADERSVRQIILNLLTNALKFTPTGGKVTVKVGWTSKGGQYISIKDTGYGIPESEIATVLSNFGRGTMAHKSAEEGTGLGLPIVQGLLELHGGTFTLKSKLREGTEVTATFPDTRVMEPMPQLRELKEKARSKAS